MSAMTRLYPDLTGPEFFSGFLAMLCHFAEVAVRSCVSASGA